MIGARVDARRLAEKLTDVEKRQLPFALSKTINEASFAVRDGWGQEIDRVFDRPTAYTRNAVLYTKATKTKLEAEVYLRDEKKGVAGVAPVKYLQWQVRGGQRAAKRSEVLLRDASIIGSDEYTVPARGFPLDAGGNLPGKTVRTILSDVQASYDELQRSNAKSRRRRSRRKDIAKRAVYFYWPGDKGAGRNTHKLPRGIYERTRTAFGWSLRGVLWLVKGVDYRPRYDVFRIARKTFGQVFGRRWPRNLADAVATARPPRGS